MRAIWLFLVILAACSAPGSLLPEMPQDVGEAYTLGSGDQVRIIIFGEEALTGEFRVNDRGGVALPLVGTVHAAGLTPTQLESAVGQALQQAKLVHQPSVSVEVLVYRPIFVLGEVNKPGQFAYQPGMTVVTAVAIAGGFTYRAIDNYASIVRTTDGKAVEMRASRQSFLRPGDVVTVFERRF